MLDQLDSVDELCNRPVPVAPASLGMSVVVRNLTYDVAHKRLIDGINLTLRPETLTVVMGPNGAGKSLLLRLLHGLIAPSGGAILWGGRPLSDQIRKRQAMVFQKPVLLRRSVAANIDFALGLSGRRDSALREHLLERVGLLAHARQPARLLSGGEQQRLVLARSLALSPEVLFLDEPTASLDPVSTAMIEHIVREVHRQGTKVIFVTHNPAEAKRLADEVVFLHRGCLVEQSSVDTFFDAPSSPEARAFLHRHI